MALDSARERLASRPRLHALVSPKWLAEQSAKPTPERRELYEMLELAADLAGVNAFLDGIERTLGAPVSGPLQKVARRLVDSDSAGYRSAIDELSFAARLADCGHEVILGNPNPDITVRSGPDFLGIELTAVRRTTGLDALQSRLASRWKWPNHRVTLFMGNRTYCPTTKEREAIVSLIEATASILPEATTQVDLSSIVDRRRLRAEVASGWSGVVATKDLYVNYDPLADILDAIEDKRRQLRAAGETMLAINLGRAHIDAHTWFLRTVTDFGFGARNPPVVEGPANLLGVLAFTSVVPGQILAWPVWLRNSARTDPDPRLLQPVLTCLGWPGASSGGRTPDGL
jgi:hypothetical protein